MNETQRNTTSGETTIDLLALAQMLLSKLHWIILGGLLAAAAAYLYTVLMISPTYVSSITMYVYNSSNTTAQQGTINSSDLSAAENLAETYSVVLTSNAVLDAVSEEVQNTNGVYVSRDQINNMITVGTVSGSQLLKITVTTTDPNLSCNIATAFGVVAPSEIVRITKAGGVELVDMAEVASVPSSPSITKNTAMGFFVGVVIVTAILVLHMLADTTIYLPEDVAKVTDATILGTVTQFGSKDVSTKSWTMVQGGSISHGKKKES